MRGIPQPLRKELTCPACGDVLAAAVFRPLPARLTLTSPDGLVVQPTGGAVLLRRRAQEESPARAEYVRRNLAELIFDLRCRRGHSTLATMPALVRAIRTTPGRWVPAG